jgi:enoyl-CoA hydratase
MLLGLTATLDELESSGEPAVLIVIGEGEKAFCAGTDLAEIQGLEKGPRMEKNKMARDLFFRVSQSNVVSIAALNGLAYGGGLELAMACHFRLALPHVKLSLPEIKLGLLPAYGGTQFLPALVGKDRAMDMMFTGDPIDAQTGANIGLITRLANADEPLLDQAIKWGEAIAGFSQPAIRAIRECVDASGSSVSEQGLQVEDTQVRKIFDTEDAKEGVAAFLEKRAPNFQNR